MGTVIRFKNYKIIVHSREHRPPHVHVTRPDGIDFRVNLITLEVMEEFIPLKTADFRQVMEVICADLDLLLNEWEKFHGKIT